MKRVFGMVEVVFDMGYLIAAGSIGVLLLGAGKTVMGCMALLLAAGDACHLIPRIVTVLRGNEETMRRALGRGKQITSITMTVFYVLLWYAAKDLALRPATIGLDRVVLALAALRILLCLLPQNRWTDRCPPVSWGICRNIPFFLLGLLTTGQLFLLRFSIGGLYWAWLAVLLSFLFYLPVVLWANQHPKTGMLMLPKTCCYIWLLVMCL